MQGVEGGVHGAQVTQPDVIGRVVYNRNELGKSRLGGRHPISKAIRGLQERSRASSGARTTAIASGIGLACGHICGRDKDAISTRLRGIIRLHRAGRDGNPRADIHI